MEKRFQMSAEGIIISALVVLTPSEQEKLECKDLEKAITHIAKNLKVDWAIETSGNIATATISKQFGPVVGDSQAHEVEMAANNFMRGIEHLYFPHEDKKEDTSTEDSSDVVITFDADNNGARIIKALREHMGLTVHAAQMRAMRGRIVCKHKDASLIMDNLDVAGAKDVHIDEKLTSNLAFCKDFIDNWEDEETTGFVCGADVMCTFKDTPGLFMKCGQICGDLLKRMFIAYVESM